MTTYFQLIWQSIFAPRAAVDLARQHPNPLKLGFIYLLATCVIAFAIEYVRPSLVQPLQLPDEADAQALSWLDMPLFAGLFSVVYYVLSFGFALWFWRRLAAPHVSTGTVQTVVAVSFASSLALLLPVDLLAELFTNSGLVPLILILFVFAAITIFLSTIYFSHGLELSIAKSFWLNVLFLFTVSAFVFSVILGVFIYEDEASRQAVGLQ